MKFIDFCRDEEATDWMPFVCGKWRKRDLAVHVIDILRNCTSPQVQHLIIKYCK